MLMLLQDARRHHRRQRQRHERRDDDGPGQDDTEFLEESPRDPLQEDHREEHRRQRHGRRDDGEIHLRRPLHAGFTRGHAAFDLREDILEHDDGIIHNETDGQHDTQQVSGC